MPRFFRGIRARLEAEEALRASEERWKFALEGAGDGVWDWNLQTNEVMFSKRWKEMLGYADDEIGTRLEEWSKRVHPEDLHGANAALADYLEGRAGSYVNEHRVRCKDGHWKWILDRGKVVGRDVRGRPLRMIGTHADISWQKRIESDIRRQRDLSVNLSLATNLDEAFRCVLDSVFQIEEIDCGGIYLVDRATGALELVAHRGLAAAFIERTSHYEAASPQARLMEDGQAFYRRLQDLSQRSDGTWEQEGLRVLASLPVRHEGRTIAVLNLGSHHCDDLSDHVRIALETIAAQIGATLVRIHSDTALRESRGNLQTLFDTVDDFLFIADITGRLLQTNPEAQRRLGYTADELRGLCVPDLYPPERRDEVLPIVNDMYFGRIAYCSLPLQCKNGTLIPAETRVTRGTWSGREALFGIARDIRERQRMEDELRDRLVELEEAMAQIKTLQGILPICSYCHRIRNDQEVWERLEKYIGEHSDAQFSHGLCPDCLKKHFPDLNTVGD